MEYAPIVIPTYNRTAHLESTVEYLKNNYLAKETILILFVDAPLKGHETIVRKHLEYCKSITGFKEVKIVERDKNYFPDSITMSIEETLDEYGKLIWMEDDIVCAKGFLKYMNTMLDRYKDDDSVFSISGYLNEDLSLPDTDGDFFKNTNFVAWGFATWKSKYDRFRGIDFNEIKRDLKNKEFKNRFLKNYNPMALYNLEKTINHKLTALDMLLKYFMLKNNTVQVSPTRSLTKNIGFDGSGVHCNYTTKFGDTVLSEKIEFTKECSEEDVIKIKTHYSGIKKATGKYRNIKVNILKILDFLHLYEFVRKYYNKIMFKLHSNKS